jgi:peptidoglycan/LPS O-acetylase OafA/YrhL
MIGARFFSQKNFSFNKNIVSRFPLLFFVFIITTLFTNSRSGKQASVLCCVGLLLLLSRILEGNKITSSIFSSLGKYSYFIYFFHFFVLQAMSNLLLTDVNRIFRSFLSFIFLFLVTIGISYLVGKLSWKFFEFPLIKYVHRKFE